MAIENFDQVTIAPAKLRPFSKFIMSIGELPTSYLDSLSYAEQITWFCDYLQNHVIPAINNNGEAVEELQNAYESFTQAVDEEIERFENNITTEFNNLEDFVNNYFENNFPALVKDTLDDMAEDGTLENLLNDAAHLIKVYNTYTDMINDSENFTNGLRLKTLGYYNINDGGDAEYIVGNSVINSNYQVDLENGLYLNLIVKNNTINIKQMGAKPLGAEKTDIKQYIDKYVSLAQYKPYKLYIPSGVWNTTPITIESEIGINIYGDVSYDTAKIGTIIGSYENQSHVLQLGSNSVRLSHWTLENISFTNNQITYSEGTYSYSNNYDTITDSIVKLIHANFGVSNNIMFNHIKGEALNISTSWENYFKLLNFRQIDNLTGAIMRFSETVNTLVATPNISANNFEKIMFEKTLGHLIQADTNCSFINNHIGVINFEDSEYTPNGETYVTFNSTSIPNYNETTDKHMAVINDLGQFACVIDSIELNNFSRGYTVSGDYKYAYDTIINAGANGFNPNTIINNIHVVGMNKKSRILKQNNYYPRKNCVLKIANVNTAYTTYPLYLDVTKYTYIECDSLPDKSDNYVRYVPTLMNSDVIPFYKGAKLYSNNNYGGLYYDPDSLNDLHLVIKPFNTNSSDIYQSTNNVLVTGSNIKIRAKVPSGTTAVLVLEADGIETQNRYTMSLVGTGSYQVYDFTDISTTYYPYGTIGAIRLSNTSEIGKDCYLDYYKFY